MPVLKQIIRSLSPFLEIHVPELTPPTRPVPEPLPEAALRHNYDPAGPQFAPMWRDPESAVMARRIT